MTSFEKPLRFPRLSVSSDCMYESRACGSFQAAAMRLAIRAYWRSRVFGRMFGGRLSTHLTVGGISMFAGAYRRSSFGSLDPSLPGGAARFGDGHFCIVSSAWTSLRGSGWVSNLRYMDMTMLGQLSPIIVLMQRSCLSPAAGLRRAAAMQETGAPRTPGSGGCLIIMNRNHA